MRQGMTIALAFLICLFLILPLRQLLIAFLPSEFAGVGAIALLLTGLGFLWRRTFAGADFVHSLKFALTAVLVIIGLFGSLAYIGSLRDDCTPNGWDIGGEDSGPCSVLPHWMSLVFQHPMLLIVAIMLFGIMGTVLFLRRRVS
jgi:hypothetical protein